MKRISRILRALIFILLAEFVIPNGLIVTCNAWIATVVAFEGGTVADFRQRQLLTPHYRDTIVILTRTMCFFAAFDRPRRYALALSRVIGVLCVAASLLVLDMTRLGLLHLPFPAQDLPAVTIVPRLVGYLLVTATLTAAIDRRSPVRWLAAIAWIAACVPFTREFAIDSGIYSLACFLGSTVPLLVVMAFPTATC